MQIFLIFIATIAISLAPEDQPDWLTPAALIFLLLVTIYTGRKFLQEIENSPVED